MVKDFSERKPLRGAGEGSSSGHDFSIPKNGPADACNTASLSTHLLESRPMLPMGPEAEPYFPRPLKDFLLPTALFLIYTVHRKTIVSHPFDGLFSSILIFFFFLNQLHYMYVILF